MPSFVPGVNTKLKVKCIVRNKEELSLKYVCFFYKASLTIPHTTAQGGTSKIKIQWDFQISKVGSLDFLDLKIIGSSASTVISGFSPCIVITIEGITVKAPNIAHLSILTSVGNNKAK